MPKGGIDRVRLAGTLPDALGEVSSIPSSDLTIPMASLASPDVTLSTVEHVRRILESSSVPVSRNLLLARLAKQSHTTSRPRLNRALGFFFDLGLAVEGSKGIQWTHTGSPSLKRAQATGRRL